MTLVAVAVAEPLSPAKFFNLFQTGQCSRVGQARLRAVTEPLTAPPPQRARRPPVDLACAWAVRRRRCQPTLFQGWDVVARHASSSDRLCEGSHVSSTPQAAWFSATWNTQTRIKRFRQAAQVSTSRRPRWARRKPD